MYIFILVLIIISSLIINANTNKGKKQYLIFNFSLLTIISGLRGETVGIDTIHYIDNFETIATRGIDTLLSHYNSDLANLYLMNFVSNLLGGGVNVYFFILASITSFSFAFFIYKYSSDIKFSTFLYFLFIFPRTMNICRMYLAISLIIIGFVFILSQKTLKHSTPFVMSAPFFHFSSLLMTPVLVFNFYRKITKTHLLLLLVSGFVIYAEIFTIIGLTGEAYSHYLDISAQYNSAISWKYLVLYGVFLILGIYYVFFTKSDKVLSNEERLVYYIMFIFFLWSVIFQFLSSKLFVLDRLYDYFYFSALIFIPNTIKYVGNNKILKYISLMAFIYAGMNAILTNVAGVYPYVFFFE